VREADKFKVQHKAGRSPEREVVLSRVIREGFLKEVPGELLRGERRSNISLRLANLHLPLL
jgi:hypothetical protein